MFRPPLKNITSKTTFKPCSRFYLCAEHCEASTKYLLNFLLLLLPKHHHTQCESELLAYAIGNINSTEPVYFMYVGQFVVCLNCKP